MTDDYRLPHTGFVRLKQLIPKIIPFCASTVWNKVKRGEFPTPIKISARVTAWRVDDIRAWLIANGCESEGPSVLKAVAPAIPTASAIHKPAPRARVVIDRAWEAQLAKEAATWREAEDIREYVVAVIGQAVASGRPLSDELLAWATAASEVANRKDPLPANVMSKDLVERSGKLTP